jgi:hypothetical protein
MHSLLVRRVILFAFVCFVASAGSPLRARWTHEAVLSNEEHIGELEGDDTKSGGNSDSATVSNPAPPPAESITFKAGLRLQPRYVFDNIDNNNDFFIARTRLKAAGAIFDVAKYYAEIKLDNVGRFAREVNAQVENAWLDFPVAQDLNIRVGLYDAVFSRNALTSDSKLLLMDRSLIKDGLTALGLADNTIGVLVHGRPGEGRFEYSAGIFDNLQFEQATSPTARQADGAMSMARAGVHLLDPATPGGYADFQSTYLGQGERLSLAANVAFLSKAREGTKEYDLIGWGGDLFFSKGPVTIEAEYDRFIEDMKTPLPNVSGEGWFAQGGYLFHPKIELAFRYQELDPDRNLAGNKVRWTSVGLNVYLRGHNLKVQAEYTLKREEGVQIKNNLLQVQLQLDF